MRITLQENQAEKVAIDLSPSDAGLLCQSGLVEVTPSANNKWGVSPVLNRVGAVSVTDLDIVVHPKAPFSSLLFMMAYASDQGFRPSEVAGAADDDLWAAIGETLVRLVKRALERGLLHGYVTREDRQRVVRGKIRISDQLSRHQDIPIPLEVRYSDFSANIPENRILRSAIRRMLGVRRLPESTRQHLLHQEGRLGAATPLTAGAPIPAWHPSRQNHRYVPALRMAELVLANVGLSTDSSEHPMAAFVVDMAAVFEDFVGIALSEALSDVSAGWTRLQYPTHLDAKQRFPIRPDVVHIVDHEVTGVFDAKYKLEVKTSDLYQMLAYCTVLGLQSGHLIYAGSRRDSDGANVEIRNAGVTVQVHALDVSVAPTGLVAQVARIAHGSLTATTSNKTQGTGMKA